MSNIDNYEFCLDIKKTVETLLDEKKRLIAQQPFQFVLNTDIEEINKTIFQKQAECPHLEQKDGYCIFCHKKIGGN